MFGRAIIIMASVLLGVFLFIGCWNSPEIPENDEQGNPLFDKIPPTVAITNPQDGAVVSGTVAISADATDNEEVKHVEFFANSIKLQYGTDAISPYIYEWDVNTLPQGSSHYIFTKATDTSNNFAYSDTVSVTIGAGSSDSIPPVASISYPSDGATVSGTVTIIVDATDNSAVYKVEFFIDEAMPPNSTEFSLPYDYAWDTSGLLNGSTHTIFAKATDTSSNFAYSDTITVTVDNSGGGDNTPPVVSITYPSDGSTVAGAFNIIANATDNVAIDSVEFFLDDVKMVDGIEYNYPYEQWWDTSVHLNGSVHYLYTKATDTSNNFSYSDTIQITVDNGAGPQPLNTDANVIVLVIDGHRYTETFGDTTHANIKFMWNNMRPQGTLFTNFRNEGITSTNPGHASIATSTWQTIANDGTERPDMPTFFEYIRKEYIVQQSEAYVVSGKAKLDVCSYSTHAGYGSAYGANVDAADRNDAATYQALINHLASDRPRLTLANFASVDRTAHTGDWPGYITAIQTADSLTYLLWQFIESDPFYAGKTYLFITNDHGRHDYDFTSHGDTCEGCTHLMGLALGPDIKPGYTAQTKYTQVDICPTVAAIFSFSTPYATGSVISEMFTAPVPVFW